MTASRRAVWTLLVPFVLASACVAVPQYSWDYVQFSEDVGSVKESVFMAGIAYDSRSRFLCAGFPAYKPGSEVAIGCFDTDKY